MLSPKPSPTRRRFVSSAAPQERRGSWSCRNLLLLVVAFLGSASFLTTTRLVPGLWASSSSSESPRLNDITTDYGLELPLPLPATLSEAYRAVAPFIFDSIQGLLQQWPNSYAPNGHSIVAGTLAPATVLYHAKHGHGPPGKPTFFAFDA